MHTTRGFSFLSVCLGMMTAWPALAQNAEPAAAAGAGASAPAQVPAPPMPVDANAPAIAPTATAAAPADSPSGRSWKAGPVFSSSIMHPLTFGAEYHHGKKWGALATYGNFTYSPSASSKVDKLDINITHYEAVGFWHPWETAFHVDAGLGYQKIEVDATSNQEVAAGGSTGEKVKLSAGFDIASTYIYAGVGWLWRWDMGLMLGTGLGLQLPVSSGSTFTAKIEGSPVLNDAIKATSAYRDLDDAVKEAGKKAGMLAMPRIEIFRAGWLF